MADEDDILKAKIAQLTFAIDRAKAEEAGGLPHAYPSPPYTSRGRSETRYNLTQHYPLITLIKDYQHLVWQPRRGTPYGAPVAGRGRAVSKFYSRAPVPHRNRTLIVNSPSNDHSGNDASAGWVTKSDRHLQLINTTVYGKKAQDRIVAMEETRQQKENRRAQHEMAKVTNYQAPSFTPGKNTTHLITIEGTQFTVADGGNKLLKHIDGTNELRQTPKRAEISGVGFSRSKNGNLYRTGLIKTQRQKAGISKIEKPCLQFSTTGTCLKGPSCRYTHDPHKVAMCKDYLQKGECRYGEYCNLSHEPTAERVPACLHFLRGSCTNDECRYAHVSVNPGAPVCKAFATYGFCPAGINCEERHVHECPNYANKGFCRNENCHLPHVDRASQLRKKATVGPGSSDEDDGVDFSSDEDVDDDDLDSDEFEYLRGDADHELEQQSDFVKL